MRKLVFLFLIIFSTGLWSQSLNGIIRDTLKKINSPKFILTLRSTFDKTIYKTNSDEDGRFDFGKVENGKYKLNIIENNDYIRNEYNIDIKDDTVVHLVANQYCKYRENKNSICPICKTDKNVIPIFYGLVTETFMKKNKSKYYFGGCELTSCNPKYYCKTEGLQF
ncbi:hypothetical protein [Chryseobacterium pennipullorum]|uniref:Carboxypeptidase regulatory-like domain-containing protein n=1 Tax=Chryseobacterium pennipullorum TaxID=2258963 RepID=A0A3D9B7M8_9FLAO|nr:hypothetical protein [Chryseobacterium pennipullorum]REC49152.1 hypothetical protein DRF67_06270 [Chryseobacterium pennipullorum]